MVKDPSLSLVIVVVRSVWVTEALSIVLRTKPPSLCLAIAVVQSNRLIWVREVLSVRRQRIRSRVYSRTGIHQSEDLQSGQCNGGVCMWKSRSKQIWQKVCPQPRLTRFEYCMFDSAKQNLHCGNGYRFGT